MLRLCRYQLDRAQARRWAIENHLAHPKPNRPSPAPVRRWQRARIGELWQLDATPHPWFPNCPRCFPMLHMLDDCSRVFTCAKICERELLLASLDFLPAAFIDYGLPLETYDDDHRLFFTQQPQALTPLGQALPFYGMTFRYTPTPQAKGKVERSHYFWQERLPAYFASEHITQIDQANPPIHQLRLHHNQHAIHRELGLKPQRAWNLAQKENRSVLRPVPRCPWWPFVWSVRPPLRVGADGRIPVGSQSMRVQAPPGTKLILCPHPSGHHSALAKEPHPKDKPLLLFSPPPK